MTSLNQEAKVGLQEGFRGEVLLPGDSGYDQARTIWNGMFDRRPAIIARCAGASDVQRAVNFAREHHLPLAVKCGGHNVAGLAVCDDGMLIDLSLMRGVHVDPQKKTAHVAGGALLGDVDAETQLYGLTVSAGIVSHTGVGGLTLGGGFGWICRKHGFSVDNLLSATVVTADGRIVTARENENADLFWALRGGGGNFGIVTSFEFRCVDIGTAVYSGVIVKKFEDARRMIQFYREFTKKLPDEMTISLMLRSAPPLPFLPQSVHGKLVVLMPFVWLGDAESGEKLINQVREQGESHGELVGVHPWRVWQSMFDPLLAHGARNYWKSHYIISVPDECIDAILAHATMPSEECDIMFLPFGGAAGRVPENATAFAHRDTRFILAAHARWRNAGDDERCMAWSRSFHEATQEYASGVYVNYLSDVGAARVRDAYPQETLKRLTAVKKTWDPHNLFSGNQNIAPSA